MSVSACARGIALGVALLAGCQAAPNLGVGCTRAADCSGGLVCRFGRCRAECATNRDCPSGSTCFVGDDHTGACSLAVDLACTSGTGTECAAGLTCIGGQCVRTCASASDCPSDGECRALPGTTISFCFDMRVPAPDAGPFDAGTDAGAAVDAGMDAPGDAGFAPPPMLSRRVCSGGGFVCAIEGAANEVHCWGDAKWGALAPGSGDCTTMTTPSTTSGAVRTATAALTGADGVACGAEFACAHLASGEVWCWGRNDASQLARPVGALACSSAAVQVALGAPTETDARILAVDAEACLFEPQSGRVRCWGADRGIAASPGAVTTLSAPTPVTAAAGAGAPLAWVSLGRGFACGITAYGDPHCWGDGARGQTMSVGSRPAWVSGLTAGREHGVLVHMTNVGVSWGSDRFSALLDPPDGALLDCGVPCSPAALVASSHIGVPISQGDASFSCTIVGGDSHVVCWGENRALQAGVPDPTDAGVAAFGTPVLLESGVLLSDVATLDVGFENACARTFTSALYCWGANDQGQLQRTPGPFDQSAAAILVTP